MQNMIKGLARKFLDHYDMLNADNKYPMGTSQPAQIDCRVFECSHHCHGSCLNVSPAITLNPDGTFVCWSKAVYKGVT